MAKHAHTTGSGASLPLALIDLDRHPDGALLRACAQATKMRDIGTTTAAPGQYPLEGAPTRYWELVSLICKTEACTAMGATMKAIFVMGDQPDPDQHSPASLYASVIRDFLRVGVQ